MVEAGARRGPSSGQRGVGMDQMAVEASRGGPDGGQRGTDVDPAVVGEAVGEVPAWTRRRRRHHGIEADAEEWAHDVDPVVVRKAVDEAPAWTRWWSGRPGGGRGAGRWVVVK
jgi:hypothetical protein